jgi:hypothetical protein
MATAVAADPVGAADAATRASGWAKKYPPLLALAAALLLAITVLPSSLNLPQSNPSTTLEYAPVPPDNNTPPLQNGNLSSLGLASTSGLTATGPPGGEPGGGALPDVTPPVGKGKTPSTKRCVGVPARQTDDPLAPPCVADFRGDNFGATYQGVTADEVRVVIYFQGNFQYLNTSKGTEVTPNNQYDDLATDAKPDDFVATRQFRVLQRYFNDRYQSYKRFVHLYVYYSGSDTSAEARKAEAADNFATIKPFAVISYAQENGQAYLDYMASHGVLNFGSYSFQPASFFSKYPKLVWGYLPSVEQLGRFYSQYICKKVVPFNASFSGNTGENGKPRKLGLLYANDPGHPEFVAMKNLVKQQVQACGGKFADERTFPAATYDYDLSHLPNYAVQNMAAFKQEGITTIIEPGGVETNQTKAAGQAKYFPEWVILGDTQNDQNTRGQNQDQTVYDHAIVVSNVTYHANIRSQTCYVAYKDTDPASPDSDAQRSCDYYPDMRQLFTGIQVAGPRLGPTSVDKGFHAIPHVASNDPKTPGCFYEPGDYTCVKDGVVEHYDSKGQSVNDNQPGCWRMTENGKRYVADGWSQDDVVTQQKPTDVCNGYSLTVFTEKPPDPNNPPTP